MLLFSYIFPNMFCLEISSLVVIRLVRWSKSVLGLQTIIKRFVPEGLFL